MRCSQCGRELPQNAQRCAFCGALVAPEITERSTHGAPREPAKQYSGTAALATTASTDPLLADTPVGSFLTGQPDVVGTVIATEAPYYEPPDIRWPTVVHRVLLITELLAYPSFCCDCGLRMLAQYHWSRDLQFCLSCSGT